MNNVIGPGVERGEFCTHFGESFLWFHKIELHTLKNTVKENETFIPYMDNIEEYLDHLFDTNKYITI